MSEKRKPTKRVKSGRVSISLWKFPTKYGERERACVQHSRKDTKTGEWRNQQVWLNIDELLDLADALEQINSEPEAAEETISAEEQDTAGEKSPASSGSMRAHSIIEYIKANSLDTGLDTFDLQELSADEVLAAYGIYAKLNPSEERMILSDLRKIVEQREFAEMAYCASRCCDPLLAFVG